MLWGLLLLGLSAAAVALLIKHVNRSRDVRQLPPGGTKRMSWWFSALCAIPWVLIFATYIEARVARLVLSRWPRPSLDDPAQLGTAPFHLVVEVMFFSLSCAIPLLVALTAWNWRKVLRDWRYSVWIGGFVVGLLALWVLVQYDPWHIWDWLLD